MRLIWATRGHMWGFRFLLSGGLEDPLAEYERAFAAGSDHETLFSVHKFALALRFPDPEGRADTAGRLIPHDLVLLPPIPSEIDSLEAGRTQIWAMLAAAYAAVWDRPRAPGRGEVAALLKAIEGAPLDGSR